MAVLILVTVLCFCGTLVFPVVWIWTYMKENKPVNFYVGDVINPATISDIKRYNEANMLLWAVFGGMITLTTAAMAVSIAATLVYIAAFVWLFAGHNRIVKKYTVKAENVNIAELNSVNK